jgi:flagellar motor component MotA
MCNDKDLIDGLKEEFEDCYEKIMMDQINKGRTKRIFNEVDYFTFINSLSGCTDIFIEKVFNTFEEYATRDIKRNFERISNRIPEKDAMEAKNQILNIINSLDAANEIELEDNYNKIDDLNSFYRSGSSLLAEYHLYRIIPETSLDYTGFINTYYDILWFLYLCQQSAISAGLLALGEILETLQEGDFIQIGLNLTILGMDSDDINRVLLNYIKQEHDQYKKLLKRIIAEGIILIVSDRYDPDELMLSLVEHFHIQDGCLDNACEEYKNGNNKVFDNLFKKGSVIYNRVNQKLEREEITFIRKALEYTNIARREGLESVENSLDLNLVSKKDLFEYGMHLVFKYRSGNGEEYPFKYYGADIIKMTLENILRRRADIISQDLYLAQIDAVLSIQRGDSPLILLELLLSHFGDDIADIARKKFKDGF